METYKLKEKKLTSFLSFSIFFTLYILLSPVSVKGQNQFIPTRKDTATNLSESFVNITFVSGLTQKGRLLREQGSSLVASHLQPYLELGINYQKNISGNFYFLVGFHATGGGRNMILNTQIKSVSFPGFNGNYFIKYNNFDFGLSLPLSIGKYWETKNYNSIYVQAGIQFHYSFGNDFDTYSEILVDSTNNQLSILSADLNSNNNRKPWFTYSLGSGYQWVLHNKNILKVGIQANLSFTHFVQGTYIVDIPDQMITTGTYYVSGNYLAVSASYGFAKFNKRKSVTL